MVTESRDPLNVIWWVISAGILLLITCGAYLALNDPATAPTQQKCMMRVWMCERTYQCNPARVRASPALCPQQPR